MSRRSGAIVLAMLITLSIPPAVRANVINDWCAHMLEAIRVDRTAPPRASRAMAATMAAAYDAVVGLEGGYEPYHVTAAAPAGASSDAAAAQAAHDVLVALFPAQAATLDAHLASSLAAIPDDIAKSDGIDWGAAVANAILALRAGDGAGASVDYAPPLGAGWWEPTPPAHAPGLLPQWPYVTPWTMTHGGQFRPEAPPPLRSTAYTQSFHEVRILGKADSAARTADQTEIALFWADGPGTATPPGHWFVIADGLTVAAGMGVLDTARTLALLGLTEGDAGIVAWDAKYAYDHWRPLTGIQQADVDGNPDTTKVSNWQPLIITPPFPTYVSGHSTFSGSGSRLLAHVFGDDTAFTTTSDDLPGIVRAYTSLAQAGEEAGQSRIYGGIHWQYDNQAGLASGRALADHVYFNFLRPVDEPGTCPVDDHTLCLGGGRFGIRADFAAAAGSGSASAIADSDLAGRFWFFDAANTELDVKLLDGCGVNERFWVFAAGLTNVEVTLTVTDHHTGAIRSYFSPAGKAFAPIQDTGAFATCP